MVRTIRWLAAPAVALLLLASCGGDGADGAGTDVTPEPGPATSTTAHDGGAAEADATTTSTAVSPATADGDPTVVDSWIDGEQTCLRWEGLDRCWLTHRPTSVTADAPAPLVIDLHGWTSSATAQRATSHIEDKAELHGFTAVWPDGVSNSWNAGARCCNPAAADGVDDVGFLRALVEHLVATDPAVDPTRVYVTGLSNGCAMAHRFAVEATDLVAAGACMSLYLLDDERYDTAPLSFLEIHGTADAVVAYEGGVWFDTDAHRNLARLAEIAGCTGDPVVTWEDGPNHTETHEDCPDGREVALTTIADGTHILYQGAGTDVDTTEIAWQFLSRFQRG